MKKIILGIAMIVGSISYLNAQDIPAGDEKAQKEKLQALYVAYITKELNLTSDEAQKFWPEHTQFDAEIKGIKADLPELDRQQKALDIRKKYQERFNKILGGNRTDRFFRKDIEFRKRLADRLRNRLKNRPIRQNPRRA